MKSFRRITVNKEKFLWKYIYDDLDFAKYPYSYYLIVPENNQKITIKIIFSDLEPPMLLDGDEGTLGTYNGKELYLNLNKPKFVAQIIEYILNSDVDLQQSGILEYEQGEKILYELGYSFQGYEKRCRIE